MRAGRRRVFAQIRAYRALTPCQEISVIYESSSLSSLARVYPYTGQVPLCTLYTMSTVPETTVNTIFARIAPFSASGNVYSSLNVI